MFCSAKVSSSSPLLLRPLSSPSVSRCDGGCSEVDSMTEAIAGQGFLLGCISCKRREEVSARATVDWHFKPLGEEEEEFRHVSSPKSERGCWMWLMYTKTGRWGKKVYHQHALPKQCHVLILWIYTKVIELHYSKSFSQRNKMNKYRQIKSFSRKKNLVFYINIFSYSSLPIRYSTTTTPALTSSMKTSSTAWSGMGQWTLIFK